jgi:protein SCO1/2
VAEKLEKQNSAELKRRTSLPAVIWGVAIILGLIIGLLLGLLTIKLIRGDLSLGSPEFRGVEMPTPIPIADFTLTAHNGQEVSLSDFRDKITLLYFGYTYCPDICPGTLAELARAMDALDSKDREGVQVIMVTVDPTRDSPEVLADYLAHFNPSFLGLTGSEDEIATAAEAVGIFYETQVGTIDSGYLVDHTASIFLVDRDGNLKLIFKFGTSAEDIAVDLERLAAG